MTKGFWKIAAIVAAATVGEGMFALPFIFHQAGWASGLFFLLLLAGFVIAAHVLYLKVLERNGGEETHLLGLAGKYLGRPGFWAGFFAIIFGLLLTLVAYFILGLQFLSLAFPSLPGGAAFIIFFALISIPVFVNDRRLIELEFLGISCTAVIILFIFLSAWSSDVHLAGIPIWNFRNFFLPFGAILFSLAGWTSIEPAYEARRAAGRVADPWRPLAFGTIIAAALYLLFVGGILASAPALSADTVSGLAGWPLWKRTVVAICGLIAIATIYMPISREIKKSIEQDLRLGRIASRAFIVLFPPALVIVGVNDFMATVGLVGGVFIGMQYLLIIAVGQRALSLKPSVRAIFDLIAVAFVLAAVYQIYIFIVH